MKKSLLFSLFLSCAFFILTSCIPEFVNPLVSPENNKPDPRLLGKWVQKDHTEQEYMEFFQKSQGELICKIFEKNSDGINKEQEIPCIASNYNGETFLSVKFKDAESGETSENYYIIKYEIKEDKLLFYHFNSDALVKAIKDQKIKGQIKTYKSSFKPKNKEKPITHDYPIIEDSSENLISFIKTMSKEALFEGGEEYQRKKETDKT